ncbi:actin cortical patch SUR7/pH-response regulator pali [Aspergillus coremiiformis]|uniref:Actin cortical patch SUR7/pH-response regulator pali n=1 Tax=Aspergillus coremiiformis TaxID=138285 RepID=A0A5N6Z960_9EURO|nr:actin cortical patch SUR7/pH-response regulator pali [Aspergillus coremiiformis]
MAFSRVLLGFLGLFFTASALLLMFLTLLGGARNSTPLNEIYFLQVDTRNIPGAPAVSRWTFWNLCAVGTNGRSDCGTSYPDFPFDPPSHRNFDTTTNIPAAFIGTSHYFLTSRFTFPFLIIALFFAVLSLFTGFLAMCTRIGGYVSSLLAWVALIFQIITTCLMTAVYVQGRNRFNSNGQAARVGSKAFGFMWTAVVCLFLSCILYCLGGTIGRKETGYSGREHRRRGFFSSQPAEANKEANP